MKKIFLLIIFLQFTNYTFSQSWNLEKYVHEQENIILNISNTEKDYINNIIKDADSLYSIPRFLLKSKSNYECYESILSKINFSENCSYQRLLIFKQGQIIGSLEPILSNGIVKYVYSDFNFNRQEYAKIISKYNYNFFEIDGLSGDLWCVKEGEVFKVELKCLNRVKLIKASDFISKNYGAQYINDLIDNKILIGKPYPLCD